MTDTLDFASDNTAGIAPRVLGALSDANAGPAAAYGDDPWTRRLSAAFSDVFGRETHAFPVFTGTAANSLALAALTPAYGAVFCHKDAHIAVDECGAPEFFTGGAKLVALPGEGGKIDPAAFRAALAAMPAGVMHHNQPASLSLTQASECGTVYSRDEIRTLTDIAHARGLRTHMDGARFANAVAALGCAPADITWACGIDVLSFGATKNGALAAEAVVYFDPALAEAHIYRQKRAGQVASKSRFVSAQLLAMLDGGHWLELASHANAAAKRLSEGAQAMGVQPHWPTEANEVFLRLPRVAADRLRTAGARFHPWGNETDPGVYRFVCSFATTDGQVDRLLDLLRDPGT